MTGRTEPQTDGAFRCRWCHRPLPVKQGLYWLDDRSRYECPGRVASAHKPRNRDLAQLSGVVGDSDLGR